MKFTIPHSLLLTLWAGFAFQGASAQSTEPERPLVDKILERPEAAEITVAELDRNNDGTIDVRDLVIFLDGQPITAYFESDETEVFRTQESVNIPIRFTKPVTGTIRIEMGGTAQQGADFGSFGVQIPGFLGIRMSLSVSEATSAILVIPITDRSTDQSGEKRLTLSLQGVATINSGTSIVTRTGNIAPGYRSAHTIVIRNAWKSWVGTIDFPKESGFTSLAVRFLMGKDKSVSMRVEDSNLFANMSEEKAQFEGEESSARLIFTDPFTGIYLPAGGTKPSKWTLDITDSPSDPEDPENIASYTANLLISDFPIKSVTKSVTGTLTLTTQN